jgi:Helix-turn-helix domain
MSSEDVPTGGHAPDLGAESRLSDPKAMRALAHPVRMALLELLAVAGTVTATQASEVLGESPANCAFHLRTLAKYGFVVEAGGGRGRERPWTAAHRSITISAQDQKDPQAALAAGALSRFWLDWWIDRARRAYGTSDPDPAWERAKEWSSKARFLTPEEAEQVTLEVRQILARYQDRDRDPSQRPAGALPVECTFFTFPITEFAGLAGETGGDSAGDTEQSRDIS